MRKFLFCLSMALIVCVSAFGFVFASEPGEYPVDNMAPYENNKHGIVGPSKFFIWDAPLFYSENYSRVIRWEVEVHGDDMGSAYLSFYTNPFSLYWNRAFYKTDENGVEQRTLAPVGTYRATITAIGGGEMEVQAQRDVEIVIPDPAKAYYTDYPDVYWPKTGSDLKAECENITLIKCIALHFLAK